ncbi:MAG: type VI secretion system lipoprotein TssJ [Zoogloea sp.]|nr:type VI secretion system lipoprotein TssJ [Zoogloea sp.]
MGAAMLLAACASGPKSYDIKAEGDTQLNRDADGQSLSVVVRVYQLKDVKEFSRLTFDTLANGRPESELLGDELLGKIDTVLVPGGEYTSTEKLLENTRYIGIVAFFRKPDAHYWRYLVSAEKVRSEGLRFRVQDCYIMLKGIKPVPLPGQPENAPPECDAAYAPPARQVSRSSGPNGTNERPMGKPQQKRGWLPARMPDVAIDSLPSVQPSDRTGNADATSIHVPAAAAGKLLPYSATAQ